jgi:hypothetical protein
MLDSGETKPKRETETRSARKPLRRRTRARRGLELWSETSRAWPDWRKGPSVDNRSRLRLERIHRVSSLRHTHGARASSFDGNGWRDVRFKQCVSTTREAVERLVESRRASAHAEARPIGKNRKSIPREDPRFLRRKRRLRKPAQRSPIWSRIKQT